MKIDLFKMLFMITVYDTSCKIFLNWILLYYDLVILFYFIKQHMFVITIYLKSI